MIVLKITDERSERIIEIAKTLVRERLVLDVNVNFNVQRLEFKDYEYTTSTIVEFSAKTKALLFNTIDNRIRELYPDDPPEIYSLPIVNMDWEHTKYVRGYLQQV